MFLQWLQLATGEETVLCARLAHPWVPFRWVPHSSGAALNASPPRQVGIRGQTPWNKIQWYHGTKRHKLIIKNNKSMVNKLKCDHLLKQKAFLKNFNPLDDQILGVSSKGENGRMTGCADFGNCMKIQVHSVSNVLLWLLEGCQYQDHISASDISPLSKSILVFQVCVNRRTWYMLQYNNTYVKKGNVHRCKYCLLFTSTILLLHNVLHYYSFP